MMTIASAITAASSGSASVNASRARATTCLTLGRAFASCAHGATGRSMPPPRCELHAGCSAFRRWPRCPRCFVAGRSSRSRPWLPPRLSWSASTLIYARSTALAGGVSTEAPDRADDLTSGGADVGSPLLVSRLDDWAIGVVLRAAGARSSLVIELTPVTVPAACRAGAGRPEQRFSCGAVPCPASPLLRGILAEDLARVFAALSPWVSTGAPGA
jgi:hypothetical protein